MSHVGRRHHDLRDALKELDIEMRWRRAERQTRLRDLEQQWLATSWDSPNDSHVLQYSFVSGGSSDKIYWDDNQLSESHSEKSDRKVNEIDCEMASTYTDAELERIRELVAVGARVGAAWAGSQRLGHCNASSTSSSASSASEKSSAVDVGALLQELRRSTPRWKSLESHRQHEALPAVALLRAGDPDADVDEWSEGISEGRRRKIKIYVEAHRKSRSIGTAPCYEVAVSAKTSIGAILDTVAPHARAAWRYTFGEDSDVDVPVNSEMWLCVRCRPGGTLLPLCKRDRISEALAEWKNVSALGWPRLFVVRAGTCL